MNRDFENNESGFRPEAGTVTPPAEPMAQPQMSQTPPAQPAAAQPQMAQMPPAQPAAAQPQMSQTPPPPPAAPQGYPRQGFGQTPYYNYTPQGYRPQENHAPYGQNPYAGGQPYSGYGANSAPNPNLYGNGNGYAAPQSPVSPVREKKGASKGFVVGMMAIGMVVSLLIGLFSGAAISGGSQPAGKGSVIINHVSKGEKDSPVTEKGSAAYVASLVADAVVEVTTETVSNNSYFGQYVEQGAGSGVIISSGDGGSYIITCAHVIEGATTVTVKLKDGTEYKASFTASDSQTDIGVIRIDVSGLTTATIANFEDVVVGEEVVAIGNPLGELGGSVTNGIISALDRDIIIDGTTYNLLQTNAEINPGNSGGGLFNMDGELIGIVNAKSGGENVEGLGFAIPIDDAETVAKELIENGYVTGRVKLGFTLIQIESQSDVQYWWQYSRYFTEYGIYIIESEDGQFQTGDRLLAINTETVSSLAELKGTLLKYEVGQTVTVTVSRINPTSGKTELHDFQLVLTEKTA